MCHSVRPRTERSCVGLMSPHVWPSWLTVWDCIDSRWVWSITHVPTTSVSETPRSKSSDWFCLFGVKDNKLGSENCSNNKVEDGRS